MIAKTCISVCNFNSKKERETENIFLNLRPFNSLALYLKGPFTNTVCARNCGLHTQKYQTNNFFLFLLSLFEPLQLGIFKKKLRPKPICQHAFVFPGVFSWFPAHIYYFIRVTIPGTLCIIFSCFYRLLWKPLNAITFVP